MNDTSAAPTSKPDQVTDTSADAATRRPDPRPPHVRPRRRSGWWPLLGLALVGSWLSLGCGNNRAGTGNTNWNLECEQDEDCPGSELCQCGLCGPACEGELDCSRANEGFEAICPLTADPDGGGPNDADAAGDDATSDDLGGSPRGDATTDDGSDASPQNPSNESTDTAPNSEESDTDAAPAPDAMSDGSATDDVDATDATATGDENDVCLPADEWVAMSSEGIDWPEGTSFSNLPSALGLWTAGELYVLNDDFALFAFEPCSNTWRSIEVEWTGDALAAELTFASVAGTRVDGSHFVVLGDGTDDIVAFLNPVDGTWRVADAAEYQAPEPAWEVPDPAVERVAFAAKGERYELRWGGHVRYSASTTPDDEPLYALQAGGQVFDTETLEWRPVSDDGAPSPRYLPNVAAVGNRFVVYGGFGEAGRSGVVVDSELRDGAIYDPDADAWAPISSFGASLLSGEELPSVSGSPLTALSNDTTVFLIDQETGFGAVYDVGRDTWTAVADAPFAPSNRWQYGTDGSLLNVSSSRSLVLEPGSASWVEVDHGTGDALPAGSSWVVEVWTGRSLLRWGASTYETTGCENPPPNVGCDPLTSYTWVAQGAMTRLL